MKVNAIIFDKDGTLLDFDAFWIAVSVKALTDVLTQFGRQDIPINELLEPLGVHNGITDINGVLCRGTYSQMSQIIYDVLKRFGCDATCEEITNAVTAAFEKNSDAGEIKPTCPNLIEVLTALKNQGKKLAVVTTDNEEVTKICLKRLGIEQFFDRIYTDDGNTPVKPDPYCVEDFLRLTATKKENIIMVGDTMTDINFAKNAGISIIGIAKNEQNRQILLPHADAVIEDPSHIFEILN